LPTSQITEWGLQSLNVLTGLTIEGDDIVETLLKERLLPISLVYLGIDNLFDVKSFEGNT
jgi:hypothetical protein